MIPYSPPIAHDRVPLIDLAASFSSDPADCRDVAAAIRAACRDIGFFYVKNHGVPQAALDDILNLARSFFALSDTEKRKADIRNSPCARGYEGLTAQTLDEGSPPDFKEGFGIGNELGPDHPYVRSGVPNTGANQWPDIALDLRPRFETYVDHMLTLGRHLGSLIALSLDLPEDYFADGLSDPMFVSRLLHYPPQPVDAAPNQIGAGAHTDWGFLTLLLQDDAGGLEVRNAAGEWLSAPPIPGTIIVNLGDIVPILTNGLYQSTLHRVHNAAGRDRYSVPTFFDPDYFYRVACVPTCRPDSGEALTFSTTVGEHVANMYRKTYGLG